MNKATAYTGGTPGPKDPVRDSDAWFTPAKYVEAARRVLGSIYLDPFSCAHAQQTVKATRFLAQADDALSPATMWAPAGSEATVWMNPPYSAALIGPAIKRLRSELQAGNVGAAVVLVNNATDTHWWHDLVEGAVAVCFTKGRIAFENADGKRISGNTRGQCFVLLGGDQAMRRRFWCEMSAFGMLL